MTPKLLLMWSVSVAFSGLAICLLALGIRGTIKVFITQDEEDEEDTYGQGHPRSVKVPPPPIPPPNIKRYEYEKPK